MEGLSGKRSASAAPAKTRARRRHFSALSVPSFMFIQAGFQAETHTRIVLSTI